MAGPRNEHGQHRFPAARLVPQDGWRSSKGLLDFRRHGTRDISMQNFFELRIVSPC